MSKPKTVLEKAIEYGFIREKYIKTKDYRNINLSLARAEIFNIINGRDKELIDTIKRFHDGEINSISLCEIGLVYHDEFTFLMMNEGYIKNDVWKWKEIQNINDSEKLKKIYDILAINSKAIQYFDAIKLDDIKDRTAYHRVENALQIVYTDQAKIYYSLDEFDKFEKYANKAVSYNSVTIMEILVKYYCDKDDLDNANIYFEKCISAEIWKGDPVKQNIYFREFNRLLSCTHIYNYLYSNGMYNDALIIAFKTEDVINNSMFFKNDKKYIEITKKRISDCKSYVNSVKNKSDNLISKYFDESVVKMMNDDIKTYIDTSLKIYDFINNSKESLDYSASLMPIMKGVEAILYEIFVSNYVEYLKKKDNINYNFIVERFKYVNKYNNTISISNKIDRIEYGDALYSIAKRTPESNSDNWIINRYFLDFYNYYRKNDNNVEILNEIADRLYSLKNKRNNVAHKNRVFKTDADECIKELISDHLNFISFLYNTFDFCFKDNK